MTLMKALLEGTYAIQPIADKIWEHVVKPVLIEAKKDNMMVPKTTNVTEYFIDTILGKTNKIHFPILITIKFTSKNLPSAQYASLLNEKGKKRINVVITLPRNIINKDMKTIKKLYMSDVIHELVHAIDQNRMGEKVFPKGFEEGKPRYQDSSGEHNWYSYGKDHMEINSVIHEIKKIITSRKKEWSSIKTTSRLERFLINEVPTIRGIVNSINIRNQKENYIKIIIKRLSREGMLPPNLTGKVMSPTDK